MIWNLRAYTNNMIFLTQGLPSPNTATRAIHGLAGIFFVTDQIFFLSFLTLLQQCVQERYLSEPMPMEGSPFLVLNGFWNVNPSIKW